MPRKIKTSLATKFSLTFAALFLVTMGAVIYAVREVVVEQFTTEYEREVAATLRSIQFDLKSRQETISQQLRQFARKIEEDNNFRLHAQILSDVTNPFLVDYAGTYMSTMGLQALEIVNQEGVVLSSGHARNTFGKRIGALIHQLRGFDSGCGLAWFEETGRTFLCLTVLESLSLGRERYYLIGGLEITPTFLSNLRQDSTDIVLVQLPYSSISSSPQRVNDVLSKITPGENHNKSLMEFEKQYSVGEFALPLVSKRSSAEATMYLLHPRSGLTQILGELNWRLFTITAIGLLGAIILSVWLTRSIARPLYQLASTANNLSLEKLNTRFDVNGNDEVGVLSEALAGMLKRLRLSRMKLAAAERKAVLTEIARQVNHDIKNGFIPIRNVMQHWQEVAENESGKLVQTFNERKSTVIESLDYLEKLARNYLRFQPPTKLTVVDINQVIENLLESYRDFENGAIQIHTDFTTDETSVQADEVQLRRAFENILQNGIQALHGGGTISVTTAGEGDQVVVSWHDTGVGIPEDVRAHLFTPHVTTKEEGTGLGLVNVKRIIEDFGGTVTIESQVGSGTLVRIALPRMTVNVNT